ncbi:unnamed protein product [Candidula unifasciata]|uniref:Uncharacterized protein n=1 Tax=Candidula unifasciata TaxID=100452 RepID=A0A8S3ZZN9_9EUPU|nr:unnamed protein product [Candidula unifasciata]
MSDHSRNMNMYFVSITVLPRKMGIDLPKCLLKIADIFSNPSHAINPVYGLKVCGEPKLIFIVRVADVAAIEHCVAEVFLQAAAEVLCQPVITYESFAQSINVAESLAGPSGKRLAEDGLFWLEFHVGYQGKTTDQLIKIWKKEAEAVFTARLKDEVSIELYKSVAQRNVHAFINAPSPEYLDALSLKLPLMLLNGANVRLNCKAVQLLENYISSVASNSV